MNPLKRTFICFAITSSCITLTAQDRSYGRSVVATQYGIVATSQVVASQAGARVLERGGSAIDAAIAAFGTYFDGLLTGDTKATEIHENARLLVKHFSAKQK